MKYFRVDLNPVPWAIGYVGVKKVGGKSIPFVARNTELHNYQQAVKAALKEHVHMFDPPLRFRVFFWRRIEDIQYEGKKSQDHVADTTNLIKGFEDACHKVFFTNDKVNIAVEGYIVRQDPDCEPHIIVGVEEVAYDYPYNLLKDVPNEILDPPTLSPVELSPEDARWVNPPDDDF